jgi:hypothetical protein
MRATAPVALLSLDAFLAWEERQPERVGEVVRLIYENTEPAASVRSA